MSGQDLDRLLAAAEPDPRRLDDLVERLRGVGQLRSVAGDPGPVLVSGGIASDSRAVRPGAVFVAIEGDHVDGHDFVAPAIAAGAVAIGVEHPIDGVKVPQLLVTRTRRSLAEAACWWYRDPSRELAVVGITGTDGKTTTSYLAVAALEACGLRPGMIGTVETRIAGIARLGVEHQTTPDAPALQAALRAMVSAGDSVAIVETTSHGLALERVAGTAYDAAIFTNLSHEHLELHGTYESYRAAKLSLFEGLGGKRGPYGPVAIVNADDPEADRFTAAARSGGARVLTYGLANDADVRGHDPRTTASGVTFAVTSEGWAGTVSVALAGRFNAHNALAVVALGRAWALDPDTVAAGIGSLECVPGRMESIRSGQPFRVVVDFAHSPASLAAVLDELVPVARAEGGGVIAVFGSAGERDTAKRPLMGRVAGERCRLVIVTDEDPRGEDGDRILEEIALGAAAAGLRRGQDLLLVRDRRSAIDEAVDRARPGDVVLLAGKGHERSIIGPVGPSPWDEVAAARAALAARGWAQGAEGEAERAG
jgi:UDP-N-acetylmuramoyl-L-alanyl-D-glutamate--2,6-diaminopimelate ligase